jgi:hypothetical protein
MADQHDGMGGRRWSQLLHPVLTDGNPTEAYGIETVNAISAIVWPSLTP